MRLAYYSPLNVRTTGVASYSLDLLPALARYADIDLFIADPEISDPAVVAPFRIYNVAPAGIRSAYPSAADASHTAYDASLFHIGNGPAHAYVYRALTGDNPGYAVPQGIRIVVLHDYVLQHLFSGYWPAPTYSEAMRREYGAAGEAVAAAILAGRQPAELFTMPLNESVIAAADAVVVHSHYAAGLLRRRYPDLPVAYVPMGVTLLDVGEPPAARARLGLPDDAFVALSLGHLSPYKRIEEALSAFALFAQEHPNSLYVLVGTHSPGFDVLRAIRVRDLEDRVRVVGFADEAAMNDYITAADICLNLRYPTAGETSASLLRLMGAGRPVMVSNIGSFMELPDDASIKIDVDRYETAEILAYLRRLADDPALRSAIGRNARHYIATQHNLDVSAAAFMEVIAVQTGQQTRLVRPSPAPITPAPLPSLTNSRRVTTRSTASSPDVTLLEPEEAPKGLRQEVARAIAELGLDPDDPSDRAGSLAVADVAQAIHDLGLD